MVDEVALLPCPFCGRGAMSRFESMEQTWSVLCQSCEAAMLYVAHSEAEAIAAWNQRPSPSTVSDEEVERVASAFPAILVDGDEDYWTTDDCHRRMARAAILALRRESA